MEFRLTDAEERAAKEFIKEHNHQAEFFAMGKAGFSALGMQFTYMITPGSLGNGVVIKCNHCGESKVITDTTNW